MDVERYQWPEPDKWQAMLANARQAKIKLPYENEAGFEVQLAKVIAQLEASAKLVAPPIFQGLPPSASKPLPPPAKPRALPVTLVKAAAATPCQAATPWPTLPPGPHATPRQVAVNRRTLHALQSAERFLAWMQATGRVGRFSSPQMTTHYRTFCGTTDKVPAAENFMRQELKRLLPDVVKGKDDENDTVGKRVRPVVWEIREDPTQMRRAA